MAGDTRECGQTQTGTFGSVDTSRICHGTMRPCGKVRRGWRVWKCDECLHETTVDREDPHAR